MSQVYEDLQQLREEGIKDLDAYLKDNLDTIFTLAAKVKVVAVNQATLEIFGAASKEALLSRIDTTFGPGATEVFADELCAIWDRKPAFRGEAKFVGVDGRKFTGLISFRIPDTPEGFENIPVTIHDISDRTRAEDRLLLFRDLLDESLDTIIISDPADGSIIDCNKKACEHLGYTRKELLDLKVKHIQTMLPDLNAWKKHVSELQHLGSKTIIGEHKRKDDSTFFVEVHIKFISRSDDDYILAVARDITERLKAEKDLRESEARFRRLFENTPAISVQGYDKNRQVIFWNKASESIYGYKADEAIGQQLENLIIPDEMRSQVIAATENWTKHGRPVPSSELRLKCADGSPIDVFSSHIMFWNQNDEAEMYCIDIDLTERKKVEVALKKSEKRLREAQKVAKIGTFEGNILSNNIWWADEIYELFGLDKKSFTPTTASFFKLLHPDDRNDYIGFARSTLEPGGSTQHVFRLKHTDGDWHYYETIADAIRDSEGKVTGRRGTTQDITERVEAEQTIRKAEQHLRTIFEQAAVGVALIDSQTGKSLRINQHYCDMVGYSLEEMSRDKHFVDITHPDDLRENLENMEKLLNGDIRQFAMEKRYHHKDGSIVWVNLSVTPAWDPGETPTNHIAVVENITQRKRSEQTLRRTQKMDAIGQLTGGIAHDFNNILGIILGNANLLKRLIPENEKALKRADTIKKSAQRAADLTNQLLGFSRREAAQVATIDINQIITGMDSIIARSLTPQIEVIHNFAEKLWLAEIDSGDFEDALLNLVLNARDAMPGGGILTIKTENTTIDEDTCHHIPNAKPGQYVLLTIIDNGEGIPTEQLDRIYEPFFTTKPQGKGTGLGLAMVFGFVERSGGCIRTDSTLNRGSTFKIYLPRTDGKHRTNTTADESLDELPRGNETILIVDDEPGLLELAQESLQALGYKTLSANSAKAALDWLDKKPHIDLTFSDVVMPGGMNGYELAEQIRNKYPNTKVLLTSGYTEKAGTKASSNQLNKDLLSKPYSQTNLANKIRELLDEHSNKDGGN